jgi:8-oxo-dGTP pyrophosphatase MutT (NUDIX family)
MQKGVNFTGICVVFVCHDGAGHILMQKRGKNTRDEQGKWDVGAGGLEFGDSVEDTLKKELLEEYCCQSIEHEFLGFREIHRENNGQKTHWISLDFKVLVDPKQVKNGEPHKFEEIGWFRLSDFPNHEKLHSQLPIFLKKYASKLK